MMRNLGRKLSFCCIGLLLIVTTCLFFILPDTHVFASSSVAIDTPTPDATSITSAANDAVSHAQDILNIVNVFAVILGVVLALFALVAAVLTILGIRS